jgi:hypothetical protein
MGSQLQRLLGDYVQRNPARQGYRSEYRRERSILLDQESQKLDGLQDSLVTAPPSSVFLNLHALQIAYDSRGPSRCGFSAATPSRCQQT